MDLSSGSPFWLVRNGLLRAYPRLREPLHCDVLVVGAGITGALIADQMQRAGLDVCVIDRREAGWGSTASSTAMLQYEIDSELIALADRYGERDAVLAYRACAQAIGKLSRLAASLRTDLRPVQSLYVASRWHHERRLRREAALRLAHGFELEIVERAVLRRRFGLDKSMALLTATAAEADPYRFAHRLLARLHRRGARVHARSELVRFSPVRGGVRAETADGIELRCRHLVFAAGYESQRWLEQRVARNRSSYALVTEPLPGGVGALRGTLFWESARPYLYVRHTRDSRLLIGGEDDSIDIPLRRDARVPVKTNRLMRRFQGWFPDVAATPAFAWAGTFAETEDGLPFFGAHPQYGPRVLFAMAYGGNGITYSQIGAELLRDRVLGRGHPCAALFAFERLER